jgi:hypothetical protein
MTTIRMEQLHGNLIVEEMNDNWMIYEILMQHKNMLHHQIDLKEEMKLEQFFGETALDGLWAVDTFK